MTLVIALESLQNLLTEVLNVGIIYSYLKEILPVEMIVGWSELVFE
jgi:hypothetical protein